MRRSWTILRVAVLLTACFMARPLPAADEGHISGPFVHENLAIYLVHGKLDWMFPVQVARQTRDALAAAGANVTYRELDDLSHCYPREMNAAMLDWLRGK